MAKIPCGIIFDGKKYTPEQFMAKLMDKSMDEYVLPYGEGVKKTLVTKRAYEGTVREGVKRALEDIGLTREIESQEEVAAKAKQFIDEAGMDVAVDAVRNGDVKGAAASAILGMKIAELDSQIAIETDTAKINALELEQAKAIEELGKLNLDAGRLNAMMNYVYQNFSIGYNVENKISQYKERNGGEISPEVEAKFRDIDAQIKELNKRIADAEAKQAEAEAQKSVSNIQESVARESKKATKERKRGKDLIAEGLDELVNALGGKKMAAGDESAKLTVALEKIGKGLIDEGLATLENVAEKVKEYIKGKLPEDIDIEKYFEGFSDRIGGLVREDVTDGKIGIPKTLIRRLVGEGITDINKLTKAVKEAVKDKYPNATEREIRDAITGYGKTVNLSQEEIDVQIRKLKQLGKVISGLEDISRGESPKKSGLQRDKPDSDVRAAQKQLREAMKGLPISEADIERQLKTQLQISKQRIRNKIEDLEREIALGKQVPKDARTVISDEELARLEKQLDNLKKEHDKIFKDDAYKEKRRLELTKKATERAIERLRDKKKRGDYTKAKRKPIIEDNILTKLLSEKLLLQEEYDKEIYKAELQNQTTWQKTKEGLWGLYDLTRVTGATGEWSFVGIQGLTQTIAHPFYAAKAFKVAWNNMWSVKKTEKWLSEIKAQPWYQVAKKSKLALTEPSAKLSAREEVVFSSLFDYAWTNILGYPAKLMGENYHKNWDAANPIKAFERASVGYLDMIRAQRFLDGMRILEMEGKNPYENLQDYKSIADGINTMTGRASLGKLEAISEPLTKIFFSPRMWASGLKTTIYSPFYLKSLTPTARKMVIGDLMVQMAVTVSMLGMVKAYVDSDDDENTSVEIDPRSSDFAKIKDGDIRFDPWGGKAQYVTYAARLLAEAWMWGTENKVIPLEGSYKKGEEYSRLGDRKRGKKTDTAFDLTLKMATNKLAPSASFAVEAAKTHTKDGERVDEYGKPFVVTDELKERLILIYANTIKELAEDGYDVKDMLYTISAFFGMGVNKYETKNDKK